MKNQSGNQYINPKETHPPSFQLLSRSLKVLVWTDRGRKLGLIARNNEQVVRWNYFSVPRTARCLHWRCLWRESISPRHAENKDRLHNNGLDIAFDNTCNSITTHASQKVSRHVCQFFHTHAHPISCHSHCPLLRSLVLFIIHSLLWALL